MKKKFLMGLAVGYVAGAASGFFVSEKRGKLKAKFWKLRVKAEVYREMMKLKRFSRKGYGDLIEKVLESYYVAREIGRDELEELEADLKDAWRDAKRRYEYRSEMEEGYEEDEDEEDEEE